MQVYPNDEGDYEPMLKIIVLPYTLQQISDDGDNKQDGLYQVTGVGNDLIRKVPRWQGHECEKEKSGHCPQSHDAINVAFFDPERRGSPFLYFPGHQTRAQNKRQEDLGDSSAPSGESG